MLRKSAAALRPLITPTGQAHLPLTAKLINEYVRTHPNKKQPGAGLVASWDESLPSVVESLLSQGLDGVEVLIEYATPGMAGEADVILAGLHPVTKDLSYVVIELKQWRKAEVSPTNPIAVDAGYDKPKLHPVRQVQRYCEYLVQNLAPLYGHRQRIAGAALLHNASSEVASLFALRQSDHGRLFTRDRLDEFQRFLSARLAAGESGSRAADVLCQAQQYEVPSSSEAFSRVGSPHPVFALQKEQEIAFQEVREAVRVSANGARHRKKVIIIQGGPGSGKTAVAVELLRTLRQENHHVVHASGSRSFTNNLRQAAANAAPRGHKGRAERQARKDFRFFQQFGDLEQNSLQVLICDEAHRVRLVSDGRDVKRWVKERGWPQADELIHAAEVPVFLLDDWQSLRPNEVGTVAYLMDRAKELGCDYEVIELPGMFRAEGSAAFREWVTKLLTLKPASVPAWVPDGRIDVRLAESPEEMETFLEKQIREEKLQARMTAGFCWEWKTPTHGELLHEVRIGDWHRPWNAKDGVQIEDVPETSQWATDPRGFGQIGCIYTAQNFEFDWAGVIIGPDLVWRDSRFTVDRSKTHDGKLKPASVSDERVDQLVRHAYHVLLTRARSGIVIYAEDPDTRNALRTLISGTIADNPLRKPPKRKLPPVATPLEKDVAEQLAIEFE
ncbi:DNA/RNA helicase domain-containing protein [Streptomyces sp. NPDC050085]|uniref:DNA/RNA helicase domain-containing protein n=1 Tax=Streptomyces sp. NPDC050085 TaxID=3365600 RepID=UPI00379FCECF